MALRLGDCFGDLEETGRSQMLALAFGGGSFEQGSHEVLSQYLVPLPARVLCAWSYLLLGCSKL